MHNYKINHENNKCFISFEDYNPEEVGCKVKRTHFIDSLINTQILVGPSTNLARNKLYFYAEEVVTLQDALKKRGSSSIGISIMNMIDCLSKQILHLESNNYAFYKLTLDSILVIDNFQFIIIDQDLLLPLNPQLPKTIEFAHPFDKDGFISPELENLIVLPSSIPYNAIYYSLGLVVLSCLKGSTINNEEEKSLLDGLANTKMYWFVKRCLHKNSEKRRLLFI